MKVIKGNINSYISKREYIKLARERKSIESSIQRLFPLNMKELYSKDVYLGTAIKMDIGFNIDKLSWLQNFGRRGSTLPASVRHIVDTDVNLLYPCQIISFVDLESFITKLQFNI